MGPGTRVVPALGTAALLALASCGGGSPQAPSADTPTPAPVPQELRAGGVIVEYQPADASWAPVVHAEGLAGLANARQFFEAPLAGELRIRVFPDRVALTTHWRLLWRDAAFQPECWMIASGDQGGVALLSPGAWARDACGHDAQDPVHRSRITAHEVVHVHHAQRNPAWGFTSGGMGWLIEGLAVHASGQHDPGQQAHARSQLAAAPPRRLSDVLPAGYDVAGSLVAWIDRRFGRAALLDLLDDTEPRTVLERLGTGEAELLAAWRADVVDGR